MRGRGNFVSREQPVGQSKPEAIPRLVITQAQGYSGPVWRAVGKQLKNYPDFVSALRSGKLDDRLDYAP